MKNGKRVDCQHCEKKEDQNTVKKKKLKQNSFHGRFVPFGEKLEWLLFILNFDGFFVVAFVVYFNFCTVSKETVCVCCLSLVTWIKRNKVTCL